MQRFWRRLAALQTRRPGVFLLAALLLAGLGAWRASKLRLVTDFADLLQQDAPSVVELRRILSRTRGLSNVFVVLEGGDPAELRRAADALVPRLAAIGPPHVALVRSGVQEARRFLMPRAGLYMTEADLEDLEGRLIEQERSAYKHAIGADLSDDLGGDNAGVPAPLRGDEFEQRLRDKLGGAVDYPDGYYLAETATGWAQVVASKAAVASGDLRLGRETLERVQTVVTSTLSELGLASRVKAGYSGDLVTGMAEYDLVVRDIIDVGGVGIALVLGVLLLFFRTPRALIALGGTIAVGCALTFGFTELAIGHLNIATAFLFSIVAGNGINFGIIWLGRFLEERRAGQTLEVAVARALDRTYAATLTAAGAAATAYAALGIGSFRGFQHFGVIGASGMALCWLSTYGVMPALTALLERVRLRRHQREGAPGHKVPFTHFEAPFVWIVRRWPGVTLAVTLAAGVAALIAGGRYLQRGALEYNVRKLRSDPDTTSEVYRVSHISSRILAGSGSAGMIVLTDDARDTPLVAAELRRARDRAPANLRPFQDVHTLDDLVPPNQPERLARLHKLARRLHRLNERGAVDDATWAKIGPLLPPPDLRPFVAADLPFQLQEPFIEKDGTRGRILYIEATKGQSDADLHYLLRWADAFRSTRLPDGRVVNGSGYAVIFADLLLASLVDMPRSVLLSLGLTALAVALFFRQGKAFAMVLASLLLALVWMMGTMAVAGVRLSFINFIALPITFGIGVDYAINIYGRYMQDSKRGILAALHGAGGPVILCSLTTSLGYLALLRAHNQAVRSLGAVAVLGEITCLGAALLFLPAALTWWHRRRRSCRRDGDGGPMKPKPRVAVFSTRFLPYSQTFVHDELSAHERYETHVFCARRLYPERFPHPTVFEAGRLYEYTRFAPAFDRRFETGSYALIHAHFGTDAVYAVPFARRHRLPLVVTFHGFDVPLLGSAERLVPMYWPYGLLGPAMLRQLALGLCASVELYEMLRELGVPADRLRVHRMGIDVDRFVPAPRHDDAEPVVVMVGRFVHKKGLVYGIRAFADARRARGRGRLVIVGDGPLQPQLVGAVREADAADHVTFAGALPHAEVAALLATADVLMAPSVTTANGDRESGTMVVKEASASGAVPLCTWHGGLPEIVDDGRTGYLVPERDVAALARRLEQLLADPALRRRFAEAGRSKMLAEYDNRLRVAALEDAYDEVLASR